MDIETLDRIRIYILPDNAVCNISDNKVSPTELSDCPCNRDKCVPEICDYYEEL